MKVLCIYHGGCDDGFGAAWAVRQALGDNVEFHAGVYQGAPPEVTGRDVVIVDFSYKRPVLEEMIGKAASLLVLDHHKTAEADLSFLPQVSLVWDEWESLIRTYGQSCIRGAQFDMSRSGAAITWDFFHPHHKRPELIEYIQDRDLWTKRLYGSDEFTAALRSYPQDFAVWDTLSVGRLIEEGAAIQRYYRTLIAGAKQHAYRRHVGGYEVPVVNASLFMASELAGELAEGEPFAAVYAESAEYVTWSLRSRAPDGLDVSEIAKAHGGGGHKHAAGFRTPRIATRPA